MSKAFRTCYSVEAELAFVAIVSSSGRRSGSRSRGASTSLRGTCAVRPRPPEHALARRRALADPPRVRVSTSPATALGWLYTNIHLPVLFGFVAAARLLAPGRYPLLRTTFVLSFLPAVLVIGLYPLAPPHWLPELGLGGPTLGRRSADGRRESCSTTRRPPRRASTSGSPSSSPLRSIWLFPRSSARLGDPRLPGARLRRHRRHRQPLRARLHRRGAHLRARGGSRLDSASRPAPLRVGRPDERGRSDGHRLCGRSLGLRLARHAVAAALEQRFSSRSSSSPES